MAPLDDAAVSTLKAAGIKEVTILAKPFEIVCEQLCGSGHTQMRGEIYFVSGAQYDRFIAKEDPKATQNQKNNVATVSLNR
jgi:heme/copper-type cytochrome/quinol oxidase subunit 2